jgi:hypothetical protein
MKIKHIIYTRFSNSAFGFDEKILLDENRLKSKLDIFLEMTYPSIINQSVNNFEWVLLVHEKIPNKIYDEILKLNLKVVKNDEYSNLIRWTFENFDFSDTDYLITSRIDDLLHKDAVKQIQESISESTLIKVFGFSNGCSHYNKNFYEMNPNYYNSGFIALGLSVIYNYKIYKNSHFSVLNLCGTHSNFRESMKKTYSEIASKIKEIPDTYFNSLEFWEEKNNEFPSYIYNRNELSDSKRKVGTNKFKPHFSDKRIDSEIIKKYFIYNN